MLSPDDIARLCERRYPSFLASIVTGMPFFPLEIRFGRPATTNEWETLRREITALAGRNLGYRIEWAETNTRRWGRQRFPQRVWFENEADFLRALEKRDEVERFRANLALSRNQCPELEPWLGLNAARLVEFADVWPDLLNVCRYFISSPRPDLYARELPIAVDTKFVERHQGILRNLLDFLLPEHAETRFERFEQRFGLRFDEPLVRFRLLDPKLKSRTRLPVDDLATPLSQFRTLGWSHLSVLISENKMTFLTLPPLPNVLGVWGGGGAAELLTTVPWLTECRILYWGDVDVHGFHILSRLRTVFPAARSVMMNETVLERFSSFVVPARPATFEAVTGLTESEHRTYLRVQTENILLEQEKIPNSFAVGEIRAAFADGERLA